MSKHKNQTETQQLPHLQITLLPQSQHPYTYRSAYSQKHRHAITTPGPGRTKQSFKNECDINTIMSRYMQTGQIDHVNKALPQFTELEGIDYQESMFIVAESRSLFAELPAEVRFQFGNDPAKFLDFVHNPDNKSEMARMGLITPEAASLLNQATPAATPPPTFFTYPCCINASAFG